jgi:hypothetical protein
MTGMPRQQPAGCLPPAAASPRCHPQGFPRADVDVTAIRGDRHAIISEQTTMCLEGEVLLLDVSRCCWCLCQQCHAVRREGAAGI